MERLVTALSRCQREEQQEGQDDGGMIKVELRCIRPFDRDCVTYLNGFLSGNTHPISSLSLVLCDVAKTISTQQEDERGRDRDDDNTLSSTPPTSSTTTTALDVICGFLACPRMRAAGITTSLKSVSFKACRLNNKDAADLYNALKKHYCKAVTQLDLSRNDFQGINGGEILNKIVGLYAAQLTHLNLSRNPGLGSLILTALHCITIGAFPRDKTNLGSRLVRLDLQGCNMGDQGISVLVSTLHKDMPLLELFLGDNDLNGTVVGTSLGVIVQRMARMKTLDISCNENFGPVGMLALGKTLKDHQCLETLSLSCCGMGDVGLKLLFEQVQWGNRALYKSLRSLYLAGNSITNGAKLGRYMMDFGRLRHLDVSRNSLGKNEAVKFGERVVNARRLERIRMVDCRLGKEGIDFMVTQVFAKCLSLQSIHLGRNQDSVPVLTVSSDTREHEQVQSTMQHEYEKCFVCLDSFYEKADLEKLPCGRHYVHAGCLHLWQDAGVNNIQRCPFRCNEEAEEYEDFTDLDDSESSDEELP